ncbi:MAG: M48 family metalloprotease [Polyangia bacterium]
MSTVDFDFQRYVARRKGARAAQVREGAAYAYPGDVKLLRTLDRLRPVQLALEEAVRLWKSVARAELLAPAIKAVPPRFETVAQAARRCAEILHIDVPQVYVVPHPSGVLTLGTDEETYIVLAQGLLDALSGDELLDVIGRECGRIQNGHVPFRTALHYLTHNAATVTRWAVRPATLTLAAWSRRADVTADRAGLLCCRSLDVSLCAMQKAFPTQDPRDQQRRQRALGRFSGSLYYRTVVGAGPGSPDEGESAEDCDAAVALILDDREPGEARDGGRSAD